jgi:N utilization substance protein B
MYPRQRARETALQLLCEQDFHPAPLPRQHVTEFVRSRLAQSPPLLDYCLHLYEGVMRHRSVIDRVLARILDNWKLSRVATTDRNVLRLGTFLLLFDKPQLPVPVIIHEAADLANRFGTEDSARFVTGILDRVAQQRTVTPADSTGPPS